MLNFLVKKNKTTLLALILFTILIISIECSPIESIQENLDQQHSAELEDAVTIVLILILFPMRVFKEIFMHIFILII